MISTKKKRTLLFFSYLLFFFNLVLFGQKDTLNVLFVGNSYTYYFNMPQLVSLLSDSTKTKLITRKSTVGGVTLKNHWLGERGLRTKEIISTGSFDVVIFQGHSMGTIEHPEDFTFYSKALSDLAKSTGAKVYFYETWGRQKVPQYQDTISRMYEKASKDNEGALVPVGKAWQLARKLRPDLELFVPDGSHPSAIGSFLIACVFTKVLTGELPRSFPSRFTTTDADGESIWLMAPDPLDMAFCVKVVERITSPLTD